MEGSPLRPAGEGVFQGRPCLKIGEGGRFLGNESVLAGTSRHGHSFFVSSALTFQRYFRQIIAPIYILARLFGRMRGGNRVKASDF